MYAERPCDDPLRKLSDLDEHKQPLQANFGIHLVTPMAGQTRHQSSSVYTGVWYSTDGNAVCENLAPPSEWNGAELSIAYLFSEHSPCSIRSDNVVSARCRTLPCGPATCYDSLSTHRRELTPAVCSRGNQTREHLNAKLGLELKIRTSD